VKRRRETKAEGGQKRTDALTDRWRRSPAKEEGVDGVEHEVGQASAVSAPRPRSPRSFPLVGCISAYDLHLTNVNSSPALTHSLLSDDDDADISCALQGIPDKGHVLTELSLFRFDKSRSITPKYVVTLRVE
jgi:hypothetical protein